MLMSNASNRLWWFLILILVWILWFLYWVFIYVPKLEEKKQEEEIKQTNSGITLTEVEKTPDLNLEGEINNSGSTTSSAEKIDELKKDLESYKIIQIWNKKFYFLSNWVELSLYLNEKLISSFPIVVEEKIEIKNIYSTVDEFLIVLDTNYYIYNSIIDNLVPLDLKMKINYIKKDDNIYLISTDEWIFVFNLINNTIEFNDMFDDFTYYNDWYLGIIKSEDSRRQKNLWIYPQEENIIFYYNPVSKEKNVLYETNLNLTKIYKEGQDIYFEENDNRTYKLNNYK